MKQECSLVRDLLPLHMEHMLRPESEDFVRNHLAVCPACAAAAKADAPSPAPAEAAPLRTIERRIRGQKLRAAALAAMLVLILAVCVFAWLTAPEYFSYQDGMLTTTETDRDLLIEFTNPAVTHCRLVCDGQEENGVLCYSLEAWTTPWDRFFPSVRSLPLTASLRKSAQDCAVYYVQNTVRGDQSLEDVLIFGTAQDAGRVSLPRLSLYYWLLLAVAAALVLGALRLALRRRRAVCLVLEPLLLAAGCFTLSYLLVLGPTGVSNSLQRDFALTLLLTVLLFCAVRLALRLLRDRRARRSFDADASGR